MGGGGTGPLGGGGGGGGGEHRTLLASGSEDAKVYVWERASATLLAALDGHSGKVFLNRYCTQSNGLFF